MNHKKNFSFTLALCATTAAATAAYAACPTEAAIFVIDQSNSMNDPGASSTGQAKRDIAYTYAQNLLAAMPSGSPVAVYGFGNYPQYSGSSPYGSIVKDFTEGLKAGTNNTAILAALATARDQTITGNWWTPLAGSLCAAIDDITVNAIGPNAITDPMCIIPADPNSPPPTRMQVYLISDGGENSTPTGDQCQGPDTAVGTSFNAALQGQGWGLTPQSWQWKVANKALTLDPQSQGLQTGMFKIIYNVALLFNYTNGLGRSSGTDGGYASPNLQDTTPQSFSTFVGSLAAATRGTYFESKMVNGAPAKLPLAGDTDPSPTRSCVDSADTNRVLGALGKKVDPTTTGFSLQDLISRDVNHDLVIDMKDYQVVVKNYGKCAS